MSDRHLVQLGQRPDRQSLGTRSPCARADAVHVELTGMSRTMLAEAIEGFRLALEHQDEAVITRTREQLGRLVEMLRG